MSGEAAASVGSIGLPRRPAFGLTAKVLAPMTLLTLLSAALGGLILKEEYKSYQTHLAQKKGELAWQVRTLYKGNRTKLLDVANLLANNADVQNGLLIGDQYNALNTIMSFLGHSGIDIINVYDLDGAPSPGRSLRAISATTMSLSPLSVRSSLSSRICGCRLRSPASRPIKAIRLWWPCAWRAA